MTYQSILMRAIFILSYSVGFIYRDNLLINQ